MTHFLYAGWIEAIYNIVLVMQQKWHTPFLRQRSAAAVVVEAGN